MIEKQGKSFFTINFKNSFFFIQNNNYCYRLILSIWVFLFLIQSTLTKNAFQLFTCKEIDGKYMHNTNIFLILYVLSTE